MEQDQRDMQAEALTVYHFLLEFDQFERKMKDVFRQALEQLDENEQDFIQKLHFFAGAMESKKVYINVENEIIAYNFRKVKRTPDLVKSFTLNQWVNIGKKWPFADSFFQDIASINRPKEAYNFYGCCKKLIQIRNILAHEFGNLKSDSKYVIEILSNQNLERHLPIWLKGYGVENFNEKTKMILSDLIFMDKMEELIAKRI